MGAKPSPIQYTFVLTEAVKFLCSTSRTIDCTVHNLLSPAVRTCKEHSSHIGWFTYLLYCLTLLSSPWYWHSSDFHRARLWHPSRRDPIYSHNLCHAFTLAILFPISNYHLSPLPIAGTIHAKFTGTKAEISRGENAPSSHTWNTSPTFGYALIL